MSMMPICDTRSSQAAIDHRSLLPDGITKQTMLRPHLPAGEPTRKKHACVQICSEA
jgi:hypothetical protein